LIVVVRPSAVAFATLTRVTWSARDGCASIGYVPPAEYEAQNHQQVAIAWN